MSYCQNALTARRITLVSRTTPNYVSNSQVVGKPSLENLIPSVSTFSLVLWSRLYLGKDHVLEYENYDGWDKTTEKLRNSEVGHAEMLSLQAAF